MNGFFFQTLIYVYADIKNTFHKHPEESCQVEVSEEDERDTPWELNTTAGEMDALHDGGEYPTGIGKDEGEEQVGVDLVP